MKNFILTKLLRYVGKRMNGHKTQFAGVGFILFGIIGIIGVMYPDTKIVELSLEQSLTAIISGLAALGLGGKLDKVKSVLQENGNGSDK